MVSPTLGPVRVVMVCAGNICRSPVAEVVLRQRLADAGLSGQVTVSSAGTGGWHVGDGMDPRASASLERHGYHPAIHRARRFTADAFAEHDLVLALDRANLADLRRIAPGSAALDRLALLRSYDASAWARGERDVDDPYYGGVDGFDRVVREVEEAVDGLVAVLRERLGAPERP